MKSETVVDIGSLVNSLPGVYGGSPRLSRSGFPIIQLVADYESGMRVAEFLEAYPYLDEESVYAGIAYYLANREVLLQELAERIETSAEALAGWQRGRAS